MGNPHEETVSVHVGRRRIPAVTHETVAHHWMLNIQL